VIHLTRRQLQAVGARDGDSAFGGKFDDLLEAPCRLRGFYKLQAEELAPGGAQRLIVRAATVDDLYMGIIQKGRD
jgi:hypothetical protein